jgi:hypothetical protein
LQGVDEITTYTAYGGLYRGKDEKNFTYSSGPFLKLKADTNKITIKGILTRVEIRKENVVVIRRHKKIRKQDDSVQTHVGFLIEHNKMNEKPYIAFIPSFGKKIFENLKSLGYNVVD